MLPLATHFIGCRSTYPVVARSLRATHAPGFRRATRPRRQHAVNLLNIDDGYLGDYLKIHIIATTNAPVRELDPAILSPGRLLGCREFRRLTRPEAQRLAQAKGLALADQPDFSLA